MRFSRATVGDLFKQLGGTFGAAVAAACCLGIPVVLSAVGAVGLSFLVHDAYLFPLFVAFVGLSLWLLYRSARSKRRLAPFWLALAGGLLSSVALWLLVTGLWPQPWAVYVGLGALVGSSFWGAFNRRPDTACDTEACEAPRPTEPVSLKRRAVNGAALATAAAGAFYAMAKSVEVFAPPADSSQIACWGINACKGQTACTTAFNACNGQNECRGRGFLNVSEAECKAGGGRPLEGSEGDPARG